MSSFDASSATCTVFAFKEGLLSPVGHDVKLRVTRFRVEVADGAIEATFEAGSLEVVCAMRDGRDHPGALSDRDRRTIESYVRDDILEARKFPRVQFRSTSVELDGDEAEVTGDLTLHGRTRSLTVRVEAAEGRRVARVRLNQPDFGIVPFKAMLGTLKIQPKVEVELSLPA
jgi:hypothetical protein